ncbi:hypothetical protein RHMOL_Rhmol11G0185500 [Rhododendron molle]|uniref:Uncharacterized protein n=1 Tax=Rhododendron molle TaxID=49168 RepID=A0ACC0LUM6_RHOML|nr:hypothetical protein RHMOL_Rhmol11G0185500 [Rhododendron molle]
MARRNPSLSSSSLFLSLLSLITLLTHHLSLSSPLPHSHFEGFDDSALDEDDDEQPYTHLPLTTPSLSLSTDPNPNSDPDSSQPSDDPPPHKPSTTAFEYWDEDEFEGLPVPQPPPETPTITENATAADSGSDRETETKSTYASIARRYAIEVACGAFLIAFTINYFTGKRENENIALAWVTRFAVRDSIFDKNFSLVGVGKDEDSPLLLKEGQNVFKFYASGRRFCQGLLATLELKSRHDLISRLFDVVVGGKDEIKIEVYMNDDAMDQVVFALARRREAKAMQKEVRDVQRFGSLVGSMPPGSRKWVAEDLGVISEVKEVAFDLITEAAVEQVFGDKAFEKYGKGFISMHFSDQHVGTHKKMLVFKFSLPDANHMAEMTRLVALVPYYIDLIGRYKVSPQGRSKTEAARQKAAQEAYKELQNARQEVIQKKKVERRRGVEEAEAKLSADAIRKKEAKERARQMKKAMPKVKMTRAG